MADTAPKTPAEKPATTRTRAAGDKPADDNTDGQPSSATTAAEVREDVAEQAETQRSGQSPYPAYEQMSTDELRSKASAAGVGVPADVEKALLIGELRKSGAVEESAGDTVTVDSAADPLPSLDLMTVDDLRSLADERDVALDEETERGYLIGQLRAVASGTTAAQSATVGNAAPADALEHAGGVEGATPQVSDKDANRGR